MIQFLKSSHHRRLAFSIYFAALRRQNNLLFFLGLSRCFHVRTHLHARAYMTSVTLTRVAVWVHSLMEREWVAPDLCSGAPIVLFRVALLRAVVLWHCLFVRVHSVHVH